MQESLNVKQRHSAIETYFPIPLKPRILVTPTLSSSESLHTIVVGGNMEGGREEHWVRAISNLPDLDDQEVFFGISQCADGGREGGREGGVR